MPHYSRLDTVVIDVAEDGHDRGLAFWRAALGHPLNRFEKYPEYHGGVLSGQEFGVLVQLLEEGPSRVHLDIHTDDVDAEVDRLERLGARRVRQAHDWWIMQDPAGLPFCVIPAPPGRLNDQNAHRWD